MFGRRRAKHWLMEGDEFQIALWKTDVVEYNLENYHTRRKIKEFGWESIWREILLEKILKKHHIGLMTSLSNSSSNW